MNLRSYARLLTIFIFFVTAVLPGGSLAAQEQGVEELTHGPLHEAFATSVSYDPIPGILVKISPPKAIDEIPPDQQPAGENVAWIPGYWGWDGEQNEFIWISGIWRNLPPGRQWFPGYWSEAGSDWQWTSGYWANQDNEEVSYLPKPPTTLENGPNVEAPSDDYIWIPGTWIYRDEDYAWSPGYWEKAQENWTWAPARYQWTTRGYLFVDGYWDYNVVRRGVVFAPVRVKRETYSRPDYHYTPTTVIAANVFLNHLFVRPNYGHYYFGDYYSPRYRDEGYISSSSYLRDRHGYDPIYAHSRWENRGDRDWDRKRSEDFNYYRDNEDSRPPRTWAALLSRNEGERRGRRDDYDFAQTLSRYAQTRDDRKGSQRFQEVDKTQRARLTEQGQQMRRFTEDRQRAENRRDEGRSDRSGEPRVATREKLTKSPLLARRIEQLTGIEAPPKKRESRSSEARGQRGGPDQGDPRERADAERGGREDRRPADPAADARRGRREGPRPLDPSEGEAAKRAEAARGREAERNDIDPRARPRRDTKPMPETTNRPERRTEPETAARPDASKNNETPRDSDPGARVRRDPKPEPATRPDAELTKPTPPAAKPEPNRSRPAAGSDERPARRTAPPAADTNRDRQARPIAPVQRETERKTRPIPEATKDLAPSRKQTPAPTPAPRREEPRPQRQAEPSRPKAPEPAARQAEPAKPAPAAPTPRQARPQAGEAEGRKRDKGR